MLLIPSLKKKTKHYSTKKIKDPIDFYLSLSAYRGEMKALVVKGQKVLKYECLAMATGFFSTKLHAPVSGIIKDIISIKGETHIHLENDFKDNSINNSPINLEDITIEKFSKLLENYGIEGAGGSRFPTQLKYKVKEDDIKTLIFNGVECEPYLSADAILMKEKSSELLKTAHLIQNILKAKRVVFVLEKQNKDIFKILKKISENLGITIEFCIVHNSYPQGGELQVIKSVTGIELKKGDIPSSKGVLVNNVGTLWAIHQAIFKGQPYIKRILTLSGNKSKKYGNYWVKIGTPISHLIKNTQENHHEKYITVLGGAMMGKIIDSETATINKGSSGLLILKKQEKITYNCIKCGECVDVCPQRLLPFEFVRNDSEFKTLKAFNLQSCIECGACAYTCPSNVPLMESIFKGKKTLAS